MSDNDRRWLGSWWRPGRSGSEEVGGELTLDSEDGLNPRLFGSFVRWTNEGHPENPLRLSEPARERMIYGYADGIKLTLLNSDCVSPRMPTAHGSEIWQPEAAVEGHLALTSGGEYPGEVFSGIRFELQQLPAWTEAVGPVGIRNWKACRLDVSAQEEELGAFKLDSGETISVHKHLLGGGSTEGLRYEIRQPVYFDVRVAEPTSWFDLANRWLQPLAALVLG